MRVESRVIAGSLLGMLLWLLGSVQVNAEIQADVVTHDVMVLETGKQQTLNVPRRIKSVAIGAPDLVDVKVLSTTKLLLTPKAVGDTRLMLSYHDGSDEQRDLRVVAPTITGALDSVEAHEAFKGVAAAADLTQTTFGTQVQTDVRIVEVNRSKVKEVGVFLSRATGGTTSVISPPGTSNGIGSIVSNTLNQLSALIVPNSEGYNLVIGSASKGWLGAINALENSGAAYTLAKPSIVSLSGQMGSFMAGGEFPVPVRQGTSDAVTIKYKQFGIRLRLTPTVLDNNRIVLKVAPEVSDLDFTTGVISGGVRVPGLLVRRSDTTVMLGDGESFVIAGLVSRKTFENADKFPGLGDIPILGWLFRSSRFERADQELLMVVTPHIVQPIAATDTLPPEPGQALKSYDPNFWEFLNRRGGAGASQPSDAGFSD